MMQDLRQAKYMNNNDFAIFQWFENDFLSYLEDWKAYTCSKENMSVEEKNKLMLSSQTIEGLKMTG